MSTRPKVRDSGCVGMAVRLLLLALALLSFLTQVRAEELVASVPVSTRDAQGKTVVAEMPITVFRPPNSGLFPAVVVSHGRPSAEKRQGMGRVKLSSVSAVLLGIGMVVVVPTRIGYGIAGGRDPEYTISCEEPRYAEALGAAADEIAAAVNYARSLPYVDPNRIYLVGQSVGGAGTIAAAVRNLPGVRAAVAFNSTHGGRPQQHPGEPCAPDVLKATFASYGSSHSNVPVLWIQTEGDRSVSMAHARNWFGAFADAGGQGEFQAFPSYRDDSHAWFANEPAQWRATVLHFFTANGLRP